MISHIACVYEATTPDGVVYRIEEHHQYNPRWSETDYAHGRSVLSGRIEFSVQEDRSMVIQASMETVVGPRVFIWLREPLFRDVLLHVQDVKSVSCHDFVHTSHMSSNAPRQVARHTSVTIDSSGNHSKSNSK